MVTKYRVNQIFIAGGMPDLTYVRRTDKKLEEKLLEVKDNLYKMATVTGATKSGKTVLTNRIFPRVSGESIWIDGGSVNNEQDFWAQIIEETEYSTEIEESTLLESSQHVDGTISGKAGISLITEAKGEVQAGIGKKQVTSKRTKRILSDKIRACSALREKRLPLIIDDFHYLERSLQANLVRALKPLIFDGLPVIIIAIPHRRYDAIKVEREMTGRLFPIEIPSWTEEELVEIADRGFPLLNIKIQDNVKLRFAREAYGSPHLMQEFCRTLCKKNGIVETQDTEKVIGVFDETIFKEIAESTGKIIFERLSKGPRQRKDRIQRELIDGSKADIYKVILYALSELKPGMEKITYEDLRNAIRKILKDKIPQAHEVSRVLYKMSQIAYSDESSTPVLDWEKEEQILHITDPFFAFYLKWRTTET